MWGVWALTSFFIRWRRIWLVFSFPEPSLAGFGSGILSTFALRWHSLGGRCCALFHADRVSRSIVSHAALRKVEDKDMMGKLSFLSSKTRRSRKSRCRKLNGGRGGLGRQLLSVEALELRCMLAVNPVLTLESGQ